MTCTDRKCRLVEVQGDQEDFADLIGRNGHLTLSDLGDDERNVFVPESRGDWLSMLVKSVREMGDRVTVVTEMDNTFVFKMY